MTDDFRPTHRHADGGVYQVLGHVLLREYRDIIPISTYTAGGGGGVTTPRRIKWRPGVRYRDQAGQEYVRSVDDFLARFKPL